MIHSTVEVTKLSPITKMFTSRDGFVLTYSRNNVLALKCRAKRYVPMHLCSCEFCWDFLFFIKVELEIVPGEVKRVK